MNMQQTLVADGQTVFLLLWPVLTGYQVIIELTLRFSYLL